MTKAESGRYDELNQRLHDEMRQLTRRHFEGVPPPDPGEPLDFNAKWFTPFSYQNYDWYGPSYECYIVILTDHIDAHLLMKLQELLREELHEWCIMVLASDTTRFADDHKEIAIFSDQVLVPKATAAAIRAPAK